MLLAVAIGAVAQNCWIKELASNMVPSPQKGFIAIGGKYIIPLNKRIVCLNDNGNIEWSHDIDLFNIKKLDSSADGNIIIVGERVIGNSPANQYPPTKNIATIIKIGIDGKLYWEKNFPPDSLPLSSATSVTQSSNGGFLFGLSQYNYQNQGSFELIETDVHGNVLLRKNIIPYYNHNITKSNNGYLLNNTNEIISLNNQLDTVWVYDKSHFGLSTINTVAGTLPSGAIVTGNNTVKIDTNGNVLWTDAAASTDVIQVPDGYIVIGSVSDTVIHALRFIRIKKLDNQGTVKWSLNITLPRSLIASSIYQNAAKQLIVIDGFSKLVLKTDSTGACLAQPIDTVDFINQFRTSMNLLRGSICNDGLTFHEDNPNYNPSLEGIVYPANTPNPKNTLYASALWMAGLDAGGNLHTAAQTYRQSGVDYLPYPLAAQPQERYGWDNIWRITNQEVYDFRVDFADNGQLNNPIPNAIKYWPAKHNTNARGAHGTPINVDFDAAPFYDNNGDGMYNVFDGDYPIVYGDEMFWWMFTDSLPIVHGETEGLALGVEVSAMAYSFKGAPGNVLERTIFTRYDITNKSTNTYHDLFLGIFSDVEIGCFNDDYIGCDTLREFYYGYNATQHDSCASNTGNMYGFGSNPPVQSVVFLSHTLDRFSLGVDASIFLNFAYDSAVYYSMQNKDENGLHRVNTVTGNREYHMFPGNPSAATEWSEVSQNNVPYDRKGIGSSGPLTMQPNETITFEAAYVVHPKGDLTNSSNVNEMQNEVEELQNFHNGYHPVSVTEVPQNEWAFRTYPNPNMGSFSINIEGVATYEVYDLAGRQVNASIEEQANGATISGLNAGTYIIQVTKGGQRKTQKVVVF